MNWKIILDILGTHITQNKRHWYVAPENILENVTFQAFSTFMWLDIVLLGKWLVYNVSRTVGWPICDNYLCVTLTAHHGMSTWMIRNLMIFKYRNWLSYNQLAYTALLLDEERRGNIAFKYAWVHKLLLWRKTEQACVNTISRIINESECY
jgi:hypothetical protein